MTDALSHRGPDARGAWIDGEAGVALGHRRLAILDVSGAAAQPMTSSCGRYVLAYNGEIYNFRRMRRELEAEGIAFSSTGDTEVLVEAIAKWGVGPALQRANGMFAFAAWDRKCRRLHLGRDRFGEKPLYYGWTRDGMFLFASELKAFHRHPSFRPELDGAAVRAYFRFGYVPAPLAIYRSVRHLPPGTRAETRWREIGSCGVEPYWNIDEVVLRAERSQFTNAEVALEELHAGIEDAVHSRTISDVPIGVFLSGGVDSTLVTAAMQARSSSPVHTFTLGFREGGFDEAPTARRTARLLGTQHTELYVEPEDALAVIPSLPDVYDEPFADSSQVPTLLVSRLARRHVTVVLSGDGGDELFAGYNRHVWGPRIWRVAQHIPRTMRPQIARTLDGRRLDGLEAAMRHAPDRLRVRHLAEKGHRIASALRTTSTNAFYWDLASIRSDNDPSIVAQSASRSSGDALLPLCPVREFTAQMLYLDTVSYLPFDILTKVDRASMSAGLETRAPFLDPHLFELAWRIPTALKVHRGENKWVLRQLLSKQYLPDGHLPRAKAGFAVPVGAWLRGPLRDWAESLLASRKLRDQGVLDATLVSDVWHRHLAGAAGHDRSLWAILMFQAWIERWGGGAS